MMLSTTPPSRRRPVERLPFANETQVQAVFEDEVGTMFGGRVVASARRGKGRLFDIDILAIDDANTPLIIECKWDRINRRAIAQLRTYRRALKRGWRSFEERVGEVRGRSVRMKWREPLLIAVGYRIGLALRDVPPDVRLVTYTYHGIALGSGPVEVQTAGEVSFGDALVEAAQKSRHPKVSKKSATHERLAPFSDEVRRAFWEIDEALRDFGEVQVAYGGKNFVRYRGARGCFAEAVIGHDSIEWFVGIRRSSHRLADSVTMVRGSDKENVIVRLRRAYERADCP